ncbi:hypothetical protein [Vibrio sp. AND4]|uniref:hypothetical protein n=1 Tax=Vibrio sp. AND4 TaxID=314289 RepID=UPI00015F2C08|nr:hypothetical protein [Vibrio sp. AND4]EDP57961.1 hypothetical protein AND4_05304 [Vibrio sp. AND4]
MWLFDNLFGSSEMVSKGISLIDDSFYTDEEKAVQKKQILKAYEPYKIAQRLLAIMFCFTFLTILTLLIVMSFFVDITTQINAIEKIMTSSLVSPVMLILGFYFAGGMIEGTIDKIKNN